MSEKFKIIQHKAGKTTIKILGSTDEDVDARQLAYSNRDEPRNLMASLQQLAAYVLIVTEQIKPKGSIANEARDKIQNVTVYGVEFGVEPETNIKLIQFEVTQKVNFAWWEYKTPWYPMKHDILKGLGVELEELYIATAAYLKDQSETMSLIKGDQYVLPLAAEVEKKPTESKDITIPDDGKEASKVPIREDQEKWQSDAPEIKLIEGTCSKCSTKGMVVEKSGICLECAADRLLKADS